MHEYRTGMADAKRSLLEKMLCFHSWWCPQMNSARLECPDFTLEKFCEQRLSGKETNVENGQSWSSWSEFQNFKNIVSCVDWSLYAVWNGACAHYVMVSKFQWKPFWLASQRDPQNDWTATQNRVNYDVIAHAPSTPGLFSMRVATKDNPDR